MAFLSVSSAATDTAFASLADLKSDLGITVSTYDDVLARLIAQTGAEMVRAACRREESLGNPFARATYIEKVPGTGDQILQLARYPIVSVSTVLCNGTDAITDYEVANGDAGQIWRENGWTLDDAPQWFTARSLSGRTGNFVFWVTYVAGFVMFDATGSNAESVTLPADLQAVCLEFARAKWFARGNDPNVESRRVGEVSETLRDPARYLTTGANGVPTELWARMAPWREVI